MPPNHFRSPLIEPRKLPINAKQRVGLGLQRKRIARKDLSPKRPSCGLT
jgi:hypothetical protein